ncbi:MAG: hypothetical protein ACRDK1_02265 [Solirubrobacterales bacterium]
MSVGPMAHGYCPSGGLGCSAGGSEESGGVDWSGDVTGVVAGSGCTATGGGSVTGGGSLAGGVGSVAAGSVVGSGGTASGTPGSGWAATGGGSVAGGGSLGGGVGSVAAGSSLWAGCAAPMLGAEAAARKVGAAVPVPGPPIIAPGLSDPERDPGAPGLRSVGPWPGPGPPGFRPFGDPLRGVDPPLFGGPPVPPPASESPGAAEAPSGPIERSEEGGTAPAGDEVAPPPDVEAPSPPPFRVRVPEREGRIVEPAPGRGVWATSDVIRAKQTIVPAMSAPEIPLPKR